MLFKTKSREVGSPLPLKPFLLRLDEGFLLGLAMDAEKGSPCVHCVELWLLHRKVASERAELRDLPVRRELIADLIEENSAHTFYEIAHDGTSTRLDVTVFPHPLCSCHTQPYVLPPQPSRKTNYAFSPIHRLKSGRFGTPEGNLWLTSAVGHAPLSGVHVSVYGVGSDKETSRLRAVEEWMKRATASDLPHALGRGLDGNPEVFQTGRRSRKLSLADASDPSPLVGAGATKEAATLDALFSWAKSRTLGKYSAQMKNPMLMVGANNWLRNKVPFFLLQEFDLHLLFYPNSTPAWVVGIAAFSRLKADEPPTFIFSAEADIHRALDLVIGKTLESLRPEDWRTEGAANASNRSLEKSKISKLNLWWTHWIYRCPKISLREVLQLESYPRLLEHWRDFLKDGEAPLPVSQINHSLLPEGIRHVVRLERPLVNLAAVRNVNGIGTLRNFEQSLL